MTDGAAPGHSAPQLNFLGLYSSVGGHTLGPYEIGARIGEGAMGQVYRAVDRRLNRPVAIKVLPHWARGDATARARFLKEARAASALNHPNIITVYDILEHEGVDFLVMEYVEGKTLLESIPRRGLRMSEAVRLATQIAEALATAHAAGILHRDLKPANVMLDFQGRIKLLDFGLAEMHDPEVDTRANHDQKQAGTRMYMAPEQLRGNHGNIYSEIFSFGLVFYQMLTGRHAFQANARADVLAAIQSAMHGSLPTGVPPTIRRILDRCLQKNPQNRYGSMRDVLRELSQTIATEGPSYSSAEPVAGRDDVPLSRPLLRGIGYRNLADGTKRLAALQNGLRTGEYSVDRKAIAVHLKRLLVNSPGQDQNGLSMPVREFRKRILDVFREAVEGQLGDQFSDSQFEGSDLFDMNFGESDLSGARLEKCFLVGSRFRQSCLDQASLAGAWIRNVDFSGATLRRTDFTDADWFNALNLTASQLSQARSKTISLCPPSIDAMHHYLRARYGFPFESWSSRIQNELIATWNEYLRPGGLREFVARQYGC